MSIQTGQKVFGAGRFWAYPTSANATVTAFGVAQDMTLDFKRDVKKLFGQNQLPVDVAAGQLSVTGKVTLGTINGRELNDLLLGASMSTGQYPYIADESNTIAGTTAGAGTFTVANGAGFQTDLGIYNTTVNGIPYTKVASSPTTGQYSVSTAGVYTFSSLEGNITIKASYVYSTVNGQNISMTNQPMGKTGAFIAVMGWLWGTDKASITLNSCIASDVAYATKLDDYMKPTFGFEACAPSSDNVLGTFSFAEVN